MEVAQIQKVAFVETATGLENASAELEVIEGIVLNVAGENLQSQIGAPWRSTYPRGTIRQPSSRSLIE